MKFSLVICTYQRPEPVNNLLESIKKQQLIPDETLIIDGSKDLRTKEIIKDVDLTGLKYFRVKEKDRGLTKQRNFGITKADKRSEILCFLDDDVVLEHEYFESLLKTYSEFPDALGVGGYIVNEVHWIRKEAEPDFDEYKMDGYTRKLGSRNLLRKKLGLLSDEFPGVMPDFSNGLSIGFLPPTGKVYPVEFFMGGVSSYRRELFEKITFSEYFEDYGLYEDMDFCLRASKLGQLYVNTGARLNHYHHQAGRPNRYRYGKMVLRNGWYVWRVKNQKPRYKARLKWHSTALLLTFIRLGNTVSTSEPKTALTESLGRLVGWWSLFFKKPKVYEK